MNLDDRFAALATLEARGIRWRVGPSACGGEGVYVAHVWREGNERAPRPVVEPTLVACLARMAREAEVLLASPSVASARRGCGTPFVTLDQRWLLRCGTVLEVGVHLCATCRGEEKR